MRRLTPLLACLLLLPGLAGAEPTRAEQEAQILATHQGYTEAVLASDWNAAARFFDAAALEQLRDTMEPVFVMDAGEGDGKTVGEMMTRRTPDELKDMDDAGFFGAFMDGIIAMNPGVAEAMAGSSMTEKGVAFGEGDEAYVVYQMSLQTGPMKVEKYDVTVMTRGADGSWALQMTGEIKGMADMLKRAFEEETARRAAENEAAEDEPADEPAKKNNTKNRRK